MTPQPHLSRLVRAFALPTGLLLALALGACSSEEGTATDAAQGPARAAGGTSDPGSRLLDAGAPLGGLTVETPPEDVTPAGVTPAQRRSP